MQEKEKARGKAIKCWNIKKLKFKNERERITQK